MKILILNDYDCCYCWSVTSIINGVIEYYDNRKEKYPDYVKIAYKYMWECAYRSNHPLHKLFKEYDIIFYYIDGGLFYTYNKGEKNGNNTSK